MEFSLEHDIPMMQSTLVVKGEEAAPTSGFIDYPGDVPFSMGGLASALATSWLLDAYPLNAVVKVNSIGNDFDSPHGSVAPSIPSSSQDFDDQSYRTPVLQTCATSAVTPAQSRPDFFQTATLPPATLPPQPSFSTARPQDGGKRIPSMSNFAYDTDVIGHVSKQDERQVLREEILREGDHKLPGPRPYVRGAPREIKRKRRALQNKISGQISRRVAKARVLELEKEARQLELKEKELLQRITEYRAKLAV